MKGSEGDGQECVLVKGSEAMDRSAALTCGCDSSRVGSFHVQEIERRVVNSSLAFPRKPREENRAIARSSAGFAMVLGAPPIPPPPCCCADGPFMIIEVRCGGMRHSYRSRRAK